MSRSAPQTPCFCLELYLNLSTGSNEEPFKSTYLLEKKAISYLFFSLLK